MKAVDIRVHAEDWPCVSKALENYLTPALAVAGLNVKVTPLPITSQYTYNTTVRGDVLTTDYAVSIGPPGLVK